ncbi:MAG TPA: helix-turn-helix domain-containing protein [Micromonosporaceae bacterium]|nr:helix-turn-helix domain-containing protein [Micromonosporaceae bacterium]
MTDEATDLAAAASSPDARTGLRAVVALRKLLETLEALQVANARRQGWSWQEIADVLGVSKQAVHKKHAAVVEDRLRRGRES